MKRLMLTICLLSTCFTICAYAADVNLKSGEITVVDANSRTTVSCNGSEKICYVINGERTSIYIGTAENHKMVYVDDFPSRGYFKVDNLLRNLLRTNQCTRVVEE